MLKDEVFTMARFHVDRYMRDDIGYTMSVYDPWEDIFPLRDDEEVVNALAEKGIEPPPNFYAGVWRLGLTINRYTRTTIDGFEVGEGPFIIVIPLGWDEWGLNDDTVGRIVGNITEFVID